MKNSDLNTWDSGAKVYLELASEEIDKFKRYIDTPQFISLLGNVKNKKILDIGCGNGDLCKHLSENGADVTGLDGSETMIESAKKNFPIAKYVVCDLMTEVTPFQDATFDIVTSKMMLMNIKDLDLLGKEVFRILKPQGLFATDVLHPFRPIIKQLKGSNDNYVKDFNYFMETKGDIKFGDRNYAFYYRSVSMYLNIFLGKGFVLNKIAEPFIDDEFVKKFPEEETRLETPISMHLLFQRPA